MWFFKKNRIKGISEHESVSLVEAFFSDSPLRRNSFLSRVCRRGLLDNNQWHLYFFYK